MIMNQNKYNLINKKFGKLRVTKKLGKNKNGSRLWNCVCECGSEVPVKTTNLLIGKTKSCGCIKRLPDGEANLNLIIKKYKESAVKRGLDFTLSKDELKKIITQNCYYCDEKPTNIIKYKKMCGTFPSNGIDRIDNRIGYTKRNSVPCCFKCNRMKSDMSCKEFLLLVKKIAIKMAC